MNVLRYWRLFVSGVWVAVAAACMGAAGPADLPRGDFEGIEEATEGLTDLTGRCAALAAGTLTCTLTDGDIALIAKASSGAITINGFAIGSATATTMKRLVINGSSGANTVILDLMGGPFAIGATSPTSGIAVDLQGGNDALKIRGSTGADTYVAGGGTGGGVAGTGAVAINGDAFVDITLAGVETFVVALSDGADSFHGRGNATTGNAFPGSITVFGGNGNDTLGGGAGDDFLNGGDGDDTFTMAAAADGADDYHGNAGRDTVDYSSRPANKPVVVTMNGNNAGGNAGAEADKVELDVEDLKGSAGNDTLTGNASANVISGMAGNDTIDGGAGNDTLNGNDGDDTFLESGLNNAAAASGSDVFNGDAGIDTVSYATRTTGVVVILDGLASDGEVGEGDRVLSDVENVTGSGTATNTLVGSSSNNTLVGSTTNDTISGGAGNDLIVGGGGNDVLNGDAGDDTFDEGVSANGADVFSGGVGIDTVTYAGRADNGECVTVTMDGVAANDGQTDTDGVDGAPVVSEGDNVKADVENVIGSDCTKKFDGSTATGDSITGNALANTLTGGLGNDTLDGSTGNDTQLGGAGNDTLIGGAGDDWLEGEAGNDVLTCGAGDDFGWFDETDSDLDGDGLCELIQTPACLPGVVTLSFTGATQSFTMPAGCGTLTIKAWGAGGGGYFEPMFGESSSGGGGGFVSGTVAVAQSTQLTVFVGGGGGSSPGALTGAAGGFNGGGAGGDGRNTTCAHCRGGGGGGGWSGVRSGATDLIIAAGGGGVSGSGFGGCGGGGATGEAGTAGNATPAGPGLGGTQFAGGVGGGAAAGATSGTAGSQYSGGGAGAGGGTDAHGSGGGGGGFFGGGGGGGGNGNVGAGGGGGSSLVPAGGTTTTASGSTPGNNADPDRGTAGQGGLLGNAGDNGRVVLSWSL